MKKQFFSAFLIVFLAIALCHLSYIIVPSDSVPRIARLVFAALFCVFLVDWALKINASETKGMRFLMPPGFLGMLAAYIVAKLLFGTIPN